MTRSDNNSPILSADNVQYEPVIIALDEMESKLLEEFRSRQPWLQSSDDIDGMEIEDDMDKAPDNPVTNEEYWLNHFEEFCNDACLMRYLRAHDYNVSQAYDSLMKTLIWRRKYQPHLITPEEIDVEMRLGKQYHNGFSKTGMPVIYIRNHLDHTDPSDRDYRRSMRYVVFGVENAIKAMPDGVEKVILVFDFRQYSPANAVPMNVSKYFLHLFTAHYPERLGFVFACSAPWYFWVFYKLISPFINPVTKSKFKFVDLKTMHKISLEKDSGSASNLLNYIDLKMLEKDFGGENEFDYEHVHYLEAMREFRSKHFPKLAV